MRTDRDRDDEAAARLYCAHRQERHYEKPPTPWLAWALAAMLAAFFLSVAAWGIWFAVSSGWQFVGRGR